MTPLHEQFGVAVVASYDGLYINAVRRDEDLPWAGEIGRAHV